jgi:uncharacterized protein (TIGR02147 family)
VNYRRILKEHLDHRVASNPRYSLRAFARDLGISASRLSAVLKGQQGLSETSATNLANRLGMDARTAQQFILMVLAADSRSKRRRTDAMRLLNSSSSAETHEDEFLQADSREVLQLSLHLNSELMPNLEQALTELKHQLLSTGLVSSREIVGTHLLHVTLTKQ